VSELQRRSGDFTQADRERLIGQFEASGLKYDEFAREHNINPQTMKNWLWIKRRGKVKYKVYTPVERKKVIEAFLASQMSQEDFCKTWGMTPSSLSTWLQRYEKEGAEGLMNRARKPGDKRLGPKVQASVNAEIVKIKKAEPSFGFKKIKHWLYRNRGVKVSTNSIGKAIKAEGLPLAKKPRKKRKSTDRVRRFERARPMQMWQSDITQFTLGPSSMRVYLTVFMDDHSRYIVGWRLQSRQTADLVMDAFKDACVRFGKPEEVLTDQGRQYFAWRGKSDLEKLLEKEQIKHVVSRAHHPQTLGKCERFWETVGNEFWTRVYPKDLEEARERLKHFINHYNHQRPHQGLDGAVPADRFFGVASEIKEVIEKTVAENSLRFAIGELPKVPAFLIGQVGDQKIAFHGTSGSFYLSQTTTNGENENGTGNNITNGASITGETTGASEGSAVSSPHELPSNPSQGLVGSGELRAKSASAENDVSDYGLLDGEAHKSRGNKELIDDASQVLADDPSGDCGNECRVTNSAEA
jgi:transposase InsO family protein/DNA-binding transcriptional regulator YiaG